jgi:single-strand DNA-binding protein
MGRGVNKCIIIGSLGGDPDIKYTPGGKAVASFSVATSEEWKSKETGAKESRVDWHSMTAFNRLGEICGEYLKKGSKVYIEGRLRTDKYDKNGETRYSTKIIVDQMQMLDSKGDKAPQHSTAGAPPSNQPQGQHQASSGGDLDEWGDEIPL